MNFVYYDPSIPLRVMLINPVDQTSSLLGVKLMRGVVFGLEQLLDLTFLVYENDFHHANRLKWELQAGGFPCYNRISITHAMPTLADADVFVFNTGLTNLNSLDGNDLHCIETFNTFYLLMTIAQNLKMPPPEPEHDIMKKYKEKKKKLRPIIVADGLVALDVLKTYSNDLPDDIFYCPTPIDGLAESILGDHLKIHCGDVNFVQVWAADDDVFHVEVQPPVYVPEKKKTRARCEWQMMAESEYEELGIDFIQFNAAWLKKDFIDKIYAYTSTHPSGNIYKATKVLKALKNIWATRNFLKPQTIEYANLGIISDGSLDTIKGLPYFLPLIFKGETHSVNLQFKDSIHLKQEIKRINKAVLANHKKLMKFCKNFYEANICRKEFIPASEESDITTTDISAITD